MNTFNNTNLSTKKLLKKTKVKVNKNKITKQKCESIIKLTFSLQKFLTNLL